MALWGRWARWCKASWPRPSLPRCVAIRRPPRKWWKPIPKLTPWNARSSSSPFAIRLLALRQPDACDLRQIVAALNMSDDLERIGDYAANIAKRAIMLAKAPVSFSLAGLAHMARVVQQNLRRTIEAYAAADASAAAALWGADEAVDDAYNGLFHKLITNMLEDERNVTACAHWLFIARNLERIGDHATNLAESTYYATQGQELAGPRPKGDDADAIHAAEGI